MPAYNLHMPAMQCGAVAKRGTHFAHHLVQIMISYAAVARLSVFVHYVDLVKAFDRLVREIVLGWPADFKGDRLQYLLDHGVSEVSSRFIVEQVALYGSFSEQWNIDPIVREMCCDLHTNTWFAYGELPTVILTRKGARQGCKIGSIIFNAGYSVGLQLLQMELQQAGVQLQSHLPRGAFWDLESSAASSDVLNAVFVDNLCLILVTALQNDSKTSLTKSFRY